MIYAARIVFLNPSNQAAVEHYDLLKKQWSENMDKVRSMVDEALDSEALIRAQGKISHLLLLLFLCLNFLLPDFVFSTAHEQASITGAHFYTNSNATNLVKVFLLKIGV